MSDAPLFNCEAAWDALTPVAQRQIGIACLVHTIGSMGNDGSPAHPAAEYAGLSALEDLVAEHVLTTDTVPRPDLAAIGVRACRKCGCTDECACAEGCHWVSEDLCSSCVPP